MLGVQGSEMSCSSTLEGAGIYEEAADLEDEVAVHNGMYRLRLPMSTIHHMCEAKHATAQSTDDDFMQRYEFTWCLRSPLEGRLLMQSGTKYHNDVLKTSCEEQASL